MKTEEIEKRYNNTDKDYPDEETMSNDIYFLLSRIRVLEEGIKEFIRIHNTPNFVLCSSCIYKFQELLEKK